MSNDLLMLGINATKHSTCFITLWVSQRAKYRNQSHRKTIHILKMGHVRSSGATLNSNGNETSTFSSVWGAASLRFGEHVEREEAWRGSGQVWYNSNHDGTRGQGSNIITSGGDSRHSQQINRQIEDVWGRIG